MKKDGFTLVELLAVVSIISLLLLLVAPKIVNQLNNSKKEVNDVTKKIIYNAAEKYLKDYNIKVRDYETKCIQVSELQDEDYLSNSILDNNSGIDLKENKSIKINYNKNTGYSYQLVTKKVCNDEQGMPMEGLTPVAYDGDNWVVVSSINKNNEWYDYDKQKWANAVILLPGITKKVGDKVKVDGTEASMMLVWIPRYEYKIEGQYGKGGTDAQHPGEIEVNFITKNTTTPSEGYRIHSAFKFGDKEISGIWVGKFEIAHTTKSLGYNTDYTPQYIYCNTETCDETQNLRILPNMPSFRYNIPLVLWYAIKSIENTNLFGLTNMDAHMIKNSEWGAVAYLSQSKYGKYGNTDYEGAQKEVYINNSRNFYTGRSGGNVSGQTPRNGEYEGYNSVSYSIAGYYTYDGYLINIETGNKTETRNINKGTGASTTGNIYGVYDMSGCAAEYVMGLYGTEKNSRITESIKTEYYDLYLTSNSSTACGNSEVCFGHALSETTGWYNDLNIMANSEKPLLIRGGSFLEDVYGANTVGIFNFNNHTGYPHLNYSTRAVFVLK